MTPEQIAQMNRIDQNLKFLTDVYYKTHYVDKDVFQNPVYFNGAVYFKLPNFLKDTILPTGSTTGAQIGITGDKVGFLGHVPVLQQAAIIAPTGGTTIDAESRTAIASIITVLQNFGLTA